MAKKKKSYNLILYELQQEALREERLKGHKVTSDIAIEKQAQNEYLAPIRNANPGRKAAESTIKSTSSNNTTSSKKSTKKEEKRTWFSKGAFSDGYDFGDITKTILGTTGDIALGAAKGLYNMGEGVADLINYGIAGVDDLLGNDYRADLRRKDAMKSSADEVFSPLEKDIDPLSVIGEKGDSVSEGLGYVGGIMLTGGLGTLAGLGTAGVTALTTGVTGFSSMGSGMGEAYQGGATDGEALKYGIISGVAEAGSELIFGGLGKAVNAVGFSKGLSSLDDALAKKISNMISSTVGKNIAEYTVKAGAEGVEEVISGIAQGIGKKMTYMSDEDLVQILKDENLLEQFVVGTVTSSIAQAPGLIKTTSEGKPFISDYTQDNQAQIQGLQQEIAKETEELNKAQDPREKQIRQEKINGLNEELNELTNAQQITDEKELRKQNFTYEAQETDSDIRKAVYESASQVMNNTETTHKFVDVVAKIAEERGTIYEFTNTEEIKKGNHNVGDNIIDGFVQDGKVKINVDSPKFLNVILGHETTHLLEGKDEHTGKYSKEYEALKQIAIDFAKSKGDYDARIERLTKLYEGTNADIEAELTSDIVGEYLFTDENFVRELSVKQPTVFEKIRNFISDLVVKFKGTEQEKQLRQLQRTFEKAYKAQGTQTTGTKYSIQGLESYTDDEIKSFSNEHILQKLEENEIYDVTIKGLELTGSRKSGTARADSDLDVVVEFEGDIREDDLFDILNEEPLYIDGIQVDINPITASKTGTLEEFMATSNKMNKIAQETGKGYKEYSATELEKLLEKYSLSSTDNQGRTLTKEQQEYFKDSKVRDKNGNLLTVYHGTKQDFTVFENKLMGKNAGNALGEGYYFTSHKAEAEMYKNLNNTDNKGKVLETYIDIKNPLNKSTYNANEMIEKVDEIVSIVEPTRDQNNEFYRYHRDYVEGKLNSFIGFIDYIKGFATVQDTTSSEIFSKLGYDGIIDGNEYVVFNSNQIKNVDNTNPTTDPDIRYSLSEDTQGRKLSEEQKEYFKNVIPELKDENGNLKVLYHGTPNEFTQFNYDFIGTNGTALGKGFYLTDDRTVAEGYGNVMEVYANITKPMLFEDRSMTKAEYKKFVEAVDKATEGQFLSDYGEVDYEGYHTVLNRALQDYEYGGDDIDLVHGVLNTAGLTWEQGFRILKDTIGYDGVVSNKGFLSREGTVYIPTLPEQIKDINNMTPTDNPDINLSLSAQNEEIAPTGNWNVRGEDVKLQVEEAIAPLQETISNLSEQLEAVLNSTEQAQKTAPIQEIQPTQPTLEEVQNLIDIRDNKSGSEYARAFFALRDKYGEVELYKSLNEYYSTGTVTQPSNVGDIDTAPVSQDIVEKQGQEAFNTLTDEQAPTVDVNNMSWEDAVSELMDSGDFEYSSTEHIPSPLDNRDIDEVGRDRKIKAYQYENPAVKPFFQAEAQNMLYDLDNTIKGERGVAIDELGNTEYYGITRQTTEAIAYLKDNYGYSYDQIRQGLNKIIEDDGKENNAVSKRIEFLLDERLREGYTTSDGIPIPANDDYISFLNEKQVTEYNKEAFNAITDEDIPMYEKIEPLQSPTTRESTPIQQTTSIRAKTAQNGNTDVTEAKQRSWAKTATESDAIKGKILLSDLDAEKIQYVPVTNKETLSKANAKLDSLGYDKALEQFYSIIKSGEIPKLVDITMGQRLMQEALSKGDKATAIEILQDITILGTEVGQITQSLSIIQRMTPAGQLRMLDKIVQRGKLRGEESFKGLELTEDMKNRIMDCYNEDGQTYDQDKLNEVMEQIKQEIADQMPVTKMDKINEWRYFSMLGNPKTHARNIISTAANYATIEVKNVLARTMEEVAPVVGFNIDRTKTWKQSSQEVKDFAEKTTLEMKDIISGENQLGIKSELKAKRKIFKTEFWNKLFGGNSDLMTKEDSWFSRPTFKRSLQEFLTANGIETQQDIQNNPELVEKGKQYALEQSQIATFRQRSWLASKISEIERKNIGTQIAVGSVLPFKKTPINIAKAGLSYSPIGALKSLTYDVYQVKKGNMEASTLIDHIAQGATGTALTLIGYMLTQAGFLNGAGDDDKEGKYDYYLGKQGYSINIGDSTYSLSWLSPIAMPLLVGANAYEKLVEKDEWNADVVLETLSQTLDPLSEMSFLSSLDDVMSSYDSGIMKWASIGQTAIQNYATQFIPTLSSQIATTMDDTKRTTKVSGDSTFKQGEELYNQLIYKIPVLRETLEPTLDIWGNEVKQSENLLQRAFENFISPYARKDSIATEIDEELKDLYGQTGDTGLLPSIPSNYVKYDGERYNMSAEEYTDYKKMYGQTANDLLEDLFRTTTYKNATSEERADMVNDVYDYARDEAKLDYLAKEGVDYTNATEDKVEVYKENLIKGAVENDMTTKEYGLYLEDPEEYKFLMEKDYEYRRKYFDTYDSLKELDESFDEQKDGINDDDELDAIYSEKKAGIVDKIINSGLDDTEKASLYKRYYNSDTVDTIMKSAISIDDYLIYETKEFKADKNAKGNSIPGSRKEKVINYVNTLDMDIGQKAILIKSTNTFKFNDYNTQIVRYLDGLGLEYDDFVSILNDLDMTVKGDMVYWD